MGKTMRIFMTVLVVVLFVYFWSSIVSVVKADNPLKEAIKESQSTEEKSNASDSNTFEGQIEGFN